MDSSFSDPSGQDSRLADQRLPNNAYLTSEFSAGIPDGLDTHGLQPEKDVSSRRTGFFIDAPQRARQGVARGRRWFLLACLIIGLLITVAPLLAGLVVQHLVYDASQTVWEIRRVASELWFLFAVPGLLLALCALVGMARKVPVAVFNLKDQKIRLGEKRFHSVPLVSGWQQQGNEVITLDEVEALQLIHYQARHLSHGEQPVDQFELNLVLHDGSRRLVAKQPGYASLVDDAKQMSLFLDVPFWDQSGQNFLY